MFFPVLTQPMDGAEESALLRATGCPEAIVSLLISFAIKYRENMSLADSRTGAGPGGSAGVMKNRKLGTRSLIRMARRVAAAPWDDDLYTLIRRVVLADFLPPVERMELDSLFAEIGIAPRTSTVSPAISF